MIFLVLLLEVLLTFGESAEPNPPNWPDSVSIFTPEMSSSEIESVVNAAYAVNGGDPRSTCDNGQFSSERFAFMFTPGTYAADIPVGYYTSVYGLGASPEDTIFSGEKGVYAEEGCGDFSVGALDTFWRSAENFHSQSSYPWPVGTGMTWAVSQAAPLRNVKVDNDLLLFEYLTEYCCDAGFASGGWASGIEVGGKVSFGSQQQYMTRSSRAAGGYDTPVWNGVFVGVDGAPEARCGQVDEDAGVSASASISVESTVPLVAEKPFIRTDDGSKFSLVVPPVVADGTPGVPWTSDGFEGAREIDFSQVYVTQPEDTSARINAKLLQGLHVVITPGIYYLNQSLHVVHPDQVLLGIGFATLVSPANGEPCVTIADVAGARVAGLLLEAGPWVTSGAMLQVGESGRFAGSESNPVVLTDVFARVGGPTTGVGPVETMFSIQSGYTIIDNTWLWRADHTSEGLVYAGENAVKHGVVVQADHVFAYGLAAEHTTEDNVLWQGDFGTTFFYQAEIMYDYVDSAQWDYSCYTIRAPNGGNITTHTASGLGCYSYFRDAAVLAVAGINATTTTTATTSTTTSTSTSTRSISNSSSSSSGVNTVVAKGTGTETESTTTGTSSGGIRIDKAMSIFLNGVEGSGIGNIINNDGQAVSTALRVQYHCDA
eukprot:CAMPEP_0174980406 /NCGR_PEP_ID=MMETSP0004_2-20121128/15335_1 /TAXON_ID=420556 /ORGANISM="Ochromonas sp., Strain CCMP1393" /LENGTH=656 /DNA_ID=CAMNT_0016232073 /DNA_START=242 /DNA_END=2212 /DNA_ORIENTATION=+